jgi:hypothetical protein
VPDRDRHANSEIAAEDFPVGDIKPVQSLLEEFDFGTRIQRDVAKRYRRVDLALVIAADRRDIRSGRRRDASAESCGAEAVGGKAEFVGMRALEKAATLTPAPMIHLRLTRCKEKVVDSLTLQRGWRSTLLDVSRTSIAVTRQR